MTRHVSTENLARFRAGDLRRSARVAAHLRRCARCRQTSDDLAEVPSLLARVPAPPMPAHLAARIETALAAEAAQRAEGAEGAGATRAAAAPAPRATHARRRPARRPVILSAPALRVMAVAGAAVVVVGGGVALLSNVGGSNSSGSASGAGAPSSHKAPKPAAAPRGSFNARAEPGQVPYRHGGRTSFIKPVQSGTDYRRARLTQQVNHALATNQAPSSKSGLPAAASGNLGTAAPRSLGGCISLVAAGSTVVLVDVAQFDHKPATVIVTRGSGSAAEQVWVVGSGCSAKVSDVLAHRVLSH